MDVVTASFRPSIYHSLCRRSASKTWRFQKKQAANCRRISPNDNKLTRCIRSALTTDTSNAAPAMDLPALTDHWKASSVLVERDLLSETDLTPKFRDIQRNDEEDAFWDYQFLYKSQRNEVDSISLTLVEGSIPPQLSGVYYLCGPGIRTDDHGSQVHPLDGHGYLRKFVIDGSNPVIYSAKYVNSEARKEEYDDESKTWRFQYRGPFSQLRGGDRFGNVKVMKNVANTSVLKWAGKLMCMYEGGNPYEMDSKTLQTLGLFNVSELSYMDTNFVGKHTWSAIKDTCTNLDGLVGSAKRAAVELVGMLIQPVLKGVFEMPKERMLSHVKMDVKRQRLVVMTCRREDMVLPKSTFTVYEMDLSMQVVQRKSFTLDEQLMIHDWGLTNNHYVLLANKVKLNSPANLLESVAGMQPMINCLALDDALPYTPMYLLPREINVTNSSKRNWRTPVKVPERLWFVHTANSFEETDDHGNLRITLDGTACSYDWFSLSNMFGYKWQKKWLDPTMMNKMNGGASHSMKNPVQLIRVSTLLSTEGDEIETKYEKFENNTCACEFPAIHPELYGSKNEYTYLVGASGRRKALPYFPFDTVLKISGDAPDGKIQSWWAGPRNFVGEPTFIPRAGSAPPGSPDFVEDDGYLIVVQYSAEEEVCYLVILDARNIGSENPVVARLQLPAKYAFPYGFHGLWTDVDIKRT